MLKSDDTRYNVIRGASRQIQLLGEFETVRLPAAHLIDNLGTCCVDLTPNLYGKIESFHLFICTVHSNFAILAWLLDVKNIHIGTENILADDTFAKEHS